ncbi:MAG: hypothetical protein KHX42_06760 [Prevotella sp.]|nr:hypothetical protein [Prevotella sp.]
MTSNYPGPQLDYTVLVRCFTFNQSKYIEDALNGFVMQQTTFPFVCLVVDDASTDGEQEVIKSWMERECNMVAAKYIDIPTTNIIIVPHKTNKNCTMAVYLLKENLYRQKERKIQHVAPWREHCRYEALCEGDDCWNNSLKLQKQVEYMDGHPNCVLVHTDFDRENVLTGKLEHAVWQHSKNYNQINREWGEQLAGLMIEGLYSSLTLTCMVRISALLKVEKEKAKVTDKKLLMGDTNLWMLLSRQGEVHLIPEVTATYHIIAESATHSRDFGRVITFYSSCIDMINAYAQYLHIKKHGERAVQTYIYFLLKDIYLDKTGYLQRINEEVVREESLYWYNTLLENTMHKPVFIKRLMLFFVKTVLKMRQDWDYFKAKYFGII